VGRSPALIWLAFSLLAELAIAVYQVTGPGVVRSGCLAFVVVLLPVVTWGR
jgi:hypothetical protein